MANNNGRKKTDAEAREYRKAVKLTHVSQGSTVEVRNVNLSGSNELFESDLSEWQTQKAKLPLRIKVKRTVRNHVFEFILGIIGTLLAALMCWGCKTLIDFKTDCAVLETKLSEVSEQIESLKTDAVTKELLSLQLDALEKALSYEQEIDRIEIENRIDLIEQQIMLIQEAPEGLAEEHNNE